MSAFCSFIRSIQNWICAGETSTVSSGGGSEETTCVGSLVYLAMAAYYVVDVSFAELHRLLHRLAHFLHGLDIVLRPFARRRMDDGDGAVRRILLQPVRRS